MAFSGLWRNRAAEETDQYTQPLGSADPSRHMADYDTAAHGVDDTAETRREPQTPYNFDYSPPTLVDSADTPLAPTVRPMVPADSEPRDHGLSSRIRPDAAGDCVPPSPVHAHDLGAFPAREYDVPTQEQVDQNYTTTRFTPNAGQAFSRMAMSRGANSLPENNPGDTAQHTAGLPPGAQAARVGWQGSPRPGFRVQLWSERRIPMHRWYGDVRPLRNYTAKSASDSPALDDGNQYRTPFADLASPRVKTYARPMQRREPRPWDETEVSDGTETTGGTEVLMSWGL